MIMRPWTLLNIIVYVALFSILHSQDQTLHMQSMLYANIFKIQQKKGHACRQTHFALHQRNFNTRSSVFISKLSNLLMLFVMQIGQDVHLLGEALLIIAFFLDQIVYLGPQRSNPRSPVRAPKLNIGH